VELVSITDYVEKQNYKFNIHIDYTVAIEALIEYGRNLDVIMQEAKNKLEEIKRKDPSTAQQGTKAAIQNKKTCIETFQGNILSITPLIEQAIIESSIEKLIVNCLNKAMSQFQKGYDSSLTNCSELFWENDEEFKEIIKRLEKVQNDAHSNLLLQEVFKKFTNSENSKKGGRTKRKSKRRKTRRR